MNRRRLALTLALAGASCPRLAVQAQADKTTITSLEGYFDFEDANGGTIMAKQIPTEDYEMPFVLDVRDAGPFAKDPLSGTVAIEWRRIFAQRATRLSDKSIIVDCNTSASAGQVAKAIRMDGVEIVCVLHGGFNDWKVRGGMGACARATKKR